MVYELKRVNVWSIAKISFVLGGILGFLAGVMVWMFSDLLSRLSLSEFSDMDGTAGLGSLGPMMPFLLAIFYAVCAMLANSFFAGVYNLLARLVGGIELSLAAPPVAVASPPPYMAPPPAPPSEPYAPTP